MLNFSELSTQQVLALAIALEEEDVRIYTAYADIYRERHPQSSRVFTAMAQEEDGHRHRLLEMYRRHFGEVLPLIRRQDVRGFVQRKPLWLQRALPLQKALRESQWMEEESRRFYERALARVSDAELRQLLGDLANTERNHEDRFGALEAEHASEPVQLKEGEIGRRLFVLQIVQPGLVGLMDGSVSTLAPLFAAALATHNSWQTFLVGLAAAIGGGISMGFAEALSDDGSLTGRGNPWLRGVACGLMTTLGGLGHTLPFLIADFRIAMVLAVAVVLVELFAIAWIRKKYMDTPFASALVQVVLGGLLVFAAGVLIGGA